MGGDPARGNQNVSQPNHQHCRNQKIQLIKAPLLSPAQAQAADPALLKILAQIQQLKQRPQCQPPSADKFATWPQQHFEGAKHGVARNH